jgi:hypothetical protein
VGSGCRGTIPARNMDGSVHAAECEVERALRRLESEVREGLEHGFFDFSITCDVIKDGKRRLTIKAGNRGNSVRQPSSEDAATRYSAQTGVSVSGVVDAILEVGRQRNVLLVRLRAALQSGDNTQALNLARQLCGLQNEESTRINPRLN